MDEYRERDKERKLSRKNARNLKVLERERYDGERAVGNLRRAKRTPEVSYEKAWGSLRLDDQIS